MQPLNTTVRPRGVSTIGWDPAADKSMIDSRRCPKATGPWAHSPDPSRPRGARAAHERSRAATSAPSPSKRISPAIPHMSLHVLSVVEVSEYPGVLRTAAAGRGDDHGPGRGDPR